MKAREWFVNVAISFDGKITNPGEQVEISSEEDWAYVHNKRNTIAAILVGSNTVIVDNPSLKTKEKYIKNLDTLQHPVRIVLDRRGRCSPDSKVFQDQDKIQTIWITNSVKNIPGVIRIKASSVKDIINQVNEYLGSIDRSGDIMIEGGSIVINLFIKSGLVSRIRIYRESVLLPQGVPLFPYQLSNKLILYKVEKLGSGIAEFYKFE